LLANRYVLDVELRPQRLMAELDMRHHPRRIGGGGGHEEMVRRQARCRAVVKDDAVFAQHEPVARLTDLERRPAVAVEPVEELRSIRPLHIDLAERRHIADADPFAHRLHFADDTVEPIILMSQRKPRRAQPKTGLDKDRASLLRPVMERGLANRLEMTANEGSGNRSEGDRGIE